MPSSPVAPGKVLNTLVGVGIVAHIHADFPRRGGLFAVNEKPEDRAPRVIRPGAIILPNLDIDEDPAKARKRFATFELDSSVDDKVNRGDDDGT